MQTLPAPFIFQEECRMKLRMRVSEGHFQCVHTIRFSEPTKIESLKRIV